MNINIFKGPFYKYVDMMRWEGGQKMFISGPRSGYDNCPHWEGEGEGKNGKNSVHVVIEYPLRFIDRVQLFSFYMMPFPINQS